MREKKHNKIHTNPSNMNTSTSKSSQSALSTRTRGLGSVTASCAEFDVKSSDTKFLAALSYILGSQHGCVWARLITICLDFHAPSHSHKCFLSAQICHMNEGIIEAL